MVTTTRRHASAVAHEREKIMELVTTIGTTDLWWDGAARAVVISDDTIEACTGITSPNHVYDALKDVRCSNMPVAVFTAVTTLAVAGHGEITGATIDNTTGVSHTDFWAVADGEHERTVHTDNPADAGFEAYKYAYSVVPTYVDALGLWLPGDGRVVFDAVELFELDTPVASLRSILIERNEEAAFNLATGETLAR